MATGRSTGHDGETHLSDLRIVLLGGRWTEKSSAGDTILGRQEFESGKRTVQCVKRQGEVAGRQLTVVDTPGWWGYLSIEGSADLLKQEIVSSVSLCSPGPHAFLIVMNKDSSFEEKHRRSMEEHLHQLLGEGVWRHSILLFTSRKQLGETAMTQHTETDKKALQWVIEKCGNRHHFLCNKNKDDVTQVTELLEKIEEMVVGNGGSEFHLDRKVLQELEERRKMIEERVTQRVTKVQKQREKLQVLLKGRGDHVSELRIVLLGWVGGGKSSSGNTILGRQEFGVWRGATQCVKRQGKVAGRQVAVVDTPSWWKFFPAEFTPDWVKQEIVNSLTVCPPGPHAILLVIPVDTSFKEEERLTLRDNMKCLGGRVWRHTIVLFTCGECLRGTTIEHHIESEGKALQWLIEKCENRYHVFDNEDTGDRRQVTELLEKIEEMEAGNSMLHLSAETHRDKMETRNSEDHVSTDTPKDPEQNPLRVRELMQTLEKEWMRREENLLNKINRNFVKIPDSERQSLQKRKVVEKQGNGRETEIKRKKGKQASTTQNIGQVSEFDSFSEAYEETPIETGLDGALGFTQGETSGLQETDRGRQSSQWTEQGDFVLQRRVFEKEWNRKESVMMEKVICTVKSLMKSGITATKEDSMAEPPEMSGDTCSEPDRIDAVRTCFKVSDWLIEKHSGK